ncbi:MAG TPA: porin [Chromatiales bacterium]|nr:porin [Chromatiales bacterium]
MRRFKQAALAAAIAGGIGAATQAQAANWLKLQGTEPPGAAARARVWGFIQPEYQRTDGTKLKAGPFSGKDAAFNMVRPDLKTDNGFNVIRARLGVRGTGFPLDSRVNYFLLAEFGNNGITRQGGGSVKLTDASVTLNHIKGARIRIGQFKYPGAEEGLQAIHVFDYINFTNVTNQLLLERFFDYDGTGTAGGSYTASNGNKPNGPVGAFRDIGIQVFDFFRRGSWEHSYAVMVGNGNGITRGDNNGSKDVYLYWSSEWVFGGKGPRRQGWKLFAWYQKGDRTITLEKGDNSTANDETKDVERKRWGVGTTYRRGRWRAAAEYVKAEGMIFNGTDGGAVPGTKNGAGTWVAGFNVLTDEEADGWYVDVGFKPHPAWELDLRYDRLNRGTKVASNERLFETWTLGVQYFFNKKSRLIVNYEFRDAEAPNLADTATPNKILDGMDDRLSAQLLIIF